MKIIKIPEDWDQLWAKTLLNNQIIGFVPTMGALHEGHLELVRHAINECDFTVVSIFVNPTQFNNPSDFESYPKTIEADLSLLEKEGIDAVFIPETHTMYPQEVELSLDFGSIEKVLEGKFRPGHFSGVGIVVSKLFNLIRPHQAFFGQKDLQQVAIIKRLVNDLSFPVELRIIPTKREKDGLALSSRNVRLSPSQRKEALLLIQSLTTARTELLAGQSWLQVSQEIQDNFSKQPEARLEYFELVHPDTFEVFKTFDPNQKNFLCVAAYLGDVRLIDNLQVND